MRPATTALLATLALAACGGDGSGPGQAATQLAFTVEPSTSTLGQVIAPVVEVSVEDASGNRVSGADNTVTLVLGVNPSGATLGGTTVVDAVGGVASFSDLQINKPGTGYTLSASASALATATSTPFNVSPIPGVAAAIAPIAGGGQTVTVGQAVATNPSVKVTDGFGDPVANVSVAFSVAFGGGSASGLDQTTDAAGVATVGQWTVGTVAGVNELRATAPGLEGSPVAFTVIAEAGPPVAVTRHSAADQIASAGSAVPEPPAVLVTDAFDNPVMDVGVTFEVTSGGGSISGPSQTTGVDGVAAVESWTLGGSAGPNTLRAISTGLDGSPVSFSATATTLPTAVTVEAHNNFFLSVRNGSGGSVTLFGSVAVDTIAAGGTVTWQWKGLSHNVTPYENSAFTTSGTHSAPFTFGPITFDTPGTYRYRCTVHSQVVDVFGLIGMTGRIVVR